LLCSNGKIDPKRFFGAYYSINADLYPYNRQGLIAINYPARKFGLSRHVTVTEAKKLCPQLIMQHVATWKEGDEKWAYHEDAAAHIGTHKVSLDPYRLESRRILACIKQSLPATTQKVEKASIDEVFLDLSAQIHTILLERYPELSLPALHENPSENLPLPPTTALDWQADALVDLDTEESEDDDPDWDDVTMLIGSEIVRNVRDAIREQLKYTCSAGIARNKVLSKLGSAHRKPNQQTVIRNRAVQQFLSDFKFTKIRNLGGKLGDQVVATFNTDTVKELLEKPIEQLKQKLGDETGTWVYEIIRGIDHSEVNPRTQIKSMLSAKSFRPSINTQEQATRWIRIFVADIYSRLAEEAVLESKRRPKTMSLHHRQSGQMRSRQAPIPTGKALDEPMLSDLANKLLDQIIMEGNVWPCGNLSLSVGGFEDGITGNMDIGGFLVRGDEAKSTRANEERTEDESLARPEKRQRTQKGGGSIQNFFTKRGDTEEHDVRSGAEQSTDERAFPEEGSDEDVSSRGMHRVSASGSPPASKHSVQSSIISHMCKRCNESFDSDELFQSHNDWHYAKDLQKEDRKVSNTSHARPSPAAAKRKKGVDRKGGTGGSGKAEKGQSNLSFG